MGSHPVPRIYTALNEEEMKVASGFSSASQYNSTSDPGDARYFGVFVGFLVVFLGVAGNGVTVWAYARNKSLQTSFNVLIANLCLVDLIFSVVVISLILPGYVNGYNVYSDPFCSMIGYIYYVSLASSLYNLVAIAVNRYVGIVKSKYYQKLFTGQRLALCIASVWLVPAILYLPLVIGGAIKWTENTLRCAIGGELPKLIKWYNLSLDITFQAIPLVILITLYSAIFKKVKQVKQKMKDHQKLSKTNSKTGRMSTVSSSMRNKSVGNASDDTEDEFKPSSMLEGFSLKPVNSSIDQNLNDRSLQASNNLEETGDEEEKSMDEALRESLTQSNDGTVDDTLTIQNPPKKRQSIWGLLLRNNKRLNLQVASVTNSPALKPAEHQLHSDTAQIKNTSAEEIFENKLEVRRKKSLSTPNLPASQFLSIEKLTAETASNLDLNPQITTETLESKTLENPKRKFSSRQIKRSRSVHDKSTNEVNRNKLNDAKEKIPWSVRIRRNTKDLVNSWSSEENEGPIGKVRFGTIAKKVQERRAKETQRNKKRQRKQRILRKKQARERQLVYSSFTICIAFAICIMPTALLYLIQEFSGTKAPASANLVVGCIAWLHAVVNPMIYGYLNAQYRKEYSKIAASISRKLTCKGNSRSHYVR